ncbi:MAG: ATP synthase F1 subunit epsilon [Cryomorphaceae bacterium]|jgi:F-type H+-transporting ATPase subunit epsilon|nr:ATP synthase F1 subunit epsilon [Cryomorphaceae bacterium]MDP4828021.1 ATP synthase F1 subunit epsilon [Flavobacteriales bacterium]
MKVEILSPEKSLFVGEADYVYLPGADGSLGILNNHAPMITTLKAGVVKIRVEKGSEQEFQVNGGTVEVLNNKVTILAE